jgi:hypothetical protein
MMNSFLSSKSKSAKTRRPCTYGISGSWQGPKRNAFRQPTIRKHEPKRIWQILYSMFF